MKHIRSATIIALFCASIAFSPCASAKDKDKKDDDKKEQLTPKQQWLLWQQQHPQQATPAPQRRQTVPAPVPPQLAPSAGAVKVLVYNRTGQPVQMSWVQAGVGAQDYGEIAPLGRGGRAKVLDTFAGHVWVFKANGGVLKRFVASATPQQELTLGDGGGAAPVVPPNPPPAPNNNRNTGGSQGADAQAFMSIHNDARAAVGVAPLRWSSACAAVAQRWADTLAAEGGGLRHSQTPGYGENVFGGGGGTLAPSDAANSWLSEKRGYRGEAISNSNFGRVGHYTQMVWGTTREVGYGIARSRNGQTYIVGVYQPSGNFLGEKPY